MISLSYSVKLYFDENKDNTVFKQLSDWIKKQPIDMQFKVQEGETMWSDPSIACVCKTGGSAIEWQNKLRKVIDEFGGKVVQEEGEDDDSE
jgi:hypothetical protein